MKPSPRCVEGGRRLGSDSPIASHDLSAIDIRHVDIPRFDSKFVDRNAKSLWQLLPEVLPTERIDAGATRFSERFGFRLRPAFVRFRLLERYEPFPTTLTEIEVRTDERSSAGMSRPDNDRAWPLSSQPTMPGPVGPVDGRDHALEVANVALSGARSTCKDWQRRGVAETDFRQDFLRRDDARSDFRRRILQSTRLAPPLQTGHRLLTRPSIVANP